MDGKVETMVIESNGSVGFTITDWSLQELVEEQGFG